MFLKTVQEMFDIRDRKEAIDVVHVCHHQWQASLSVIVCFPNGGPIIDELQHVLLNLFQDVTQDKRCKGRKYWASLCKALLYWYLKPISIITLGAICAKVAVEEVSKRFELREFVCDDSPQLFARDSVEYVSDVKRH